MSSQGAVWAKAGVEQNRNVVSRCMRASGVMLLGKQESTDTFYLSNSWEKGEDVK